MAKTEMRKTKNSEEIDLIAEFDMEYGQSEHWSEETIREFDRRWDEIRNKYQKVIDHGEN